jgi:hypothetical protein
VKLIDLPPKTPQQAKGKIFLINVIFLCDWRFCFSGRQQQLLIKHKQQRLHFCIQCFLNGNSASDDSNLIIPVAALNYLPEDVR